MHTAVALGIFDGMHLGHRDVIKNTLGYCENDIKPAVFTFNSDTLEKKHNMPFRPIYKNSYKLKMLESMGFEYCYCPDFSDIMNMTAEEFAENILCKKMKAVHVVCGKGFRFGKYASGDIEELYKLGKKYGFEVTAVSPVTDNENKISSSLIRNFLTEGKIQEANRLLGKNYEIQGEVVHGRQLGRTIGIPTINQNFSENQLILMYGVYASRTVIDGKEYKSITNIGVKPTVDSNIKPLAETHIIDFSGDIYGKEITVIIDRMIRKEKKFSSVDELKNAIDTDIKSVL